MTSYPISFMITTDAAAHNRRVTKLTLQTGAVLGGWNGKDLLAYRMESSRRRLGRKDFQRIRSMSSSYRRSTKT